MTVNESPDNFEGEEQARQPRVAHEQPGEHPRFTVVGIGASAGGLVALQAFFDALPADTGMAFVVVTHMDPERESMLPELLQKHTAMPVGQVRDRMPVEPNHVYVIPPARRIVITDTHLDTQEFEQPRGRRAPIDHFFRSLAEVHRDCVAVILSGGGTDGAVGVKAIKEQGGLLLVQDPDEAEHDSMPRAAIATGLAAVVLPVAQLAEKLVAYRRNGVHLPRDVESLTAEELDKVYRILTQVQVQTGHDFGQYRRSTILRRIQRRMQLHGHATLDAYLDYLRHTEGEAQALVNDLLISVTNFFRDKEAWEALAEQVIPRLFEGKEQEETVRAWTIGCATGEEAYSVAMLLLEHRATMRLSPSARPAIQVFASDLDEAALITARDGLYPEAIEADVSPERLARFFVKEGSYYRVRRELRDLVLFANHSVLRDPPFSRLDLISCRNLLIYLQRELQQNVFEIFHYALNPERYLFLGSAESAAMVHELFRTVDKSQRIYQARPWRGEQPHLPALPLTVGHRAREQQLPAVAAQPRPPAGKAAGAMAGYHLEMLEELAPASVLIDAAYHMVHLSPTAGRYLRIPAGPVTADLLKLVRPELQLELRAALFQAFGQNKSVVTGPVFVQFNGRPRRVTIAVRPRTAASTPGEGESERLALVFFLEDEFAEERFTATKEGESRGDDAQRETLVAHLEAEVQRLREQLQATGEEYESSTEELKAANEELQSINEEYRSAAEELETSREELQSVNEELQTVNAELKNKLEEISRTHSDLENLMAATEIATLFLDRELRIQRYTPGTAELFNIMPGDRGRPIGHLTNKLDYSALADDAGRVLRNPAPIEREVQDGAGRWFLARLRPYRTVDDRIDGVVLTFVDVTELKETETALHLEKAYSEKIVHTLREGLLVLKPELTVEFANESFYQMFGVDERETVGKLVYELGNGQWHTPELRRLLEEILPEQSVFNDYRVEYDFEDVGRRVMLLNARRLDHVERILLAIEDFTERERYEEALRQLNETLEQRVLKRTVQVRRLASELITSEQTVRQRISQTLHDDLQQLLYAAEMQLQFLREDEGENEELDELAAMIGKSIQLTRQLTVELHPPVLKGEGLREALMWLAKHMGEVYKLQVTVEASDHPDTATTEKRVQLFQIVRELLFNVVKHAGVLAAAVTLKEEENGLTVTVSDQGRGFDVEKVLAEENPGFGLRSVHERLQLFDGRADIDSWPGEGTRVTLFLPDTHTRPAAGGEVEA